MLANLDEVDGALSMPRLRPSALPEIYNRSILCSRQGFTNDPGGPSVLVLVERRRARKQARTATSAADITR
jgi:hypothetical protein